MLYLTRTILNGNAVDQSIRFYSKTGDYDAVGVLPTGDRDRFGVIIVEAATSKLQAIGER